MTLDEIREFMRSHLLAVQSSIAADEQPQAAVVGIAVGEDGCVFFDTLATSRKCSNLRRDPRVAMVIGWDLEQGRTLQLEGVADEPRGDALAELKQVYFARFPDGVEREAWPDITYFRVRPTWLRYSDFTCVPPKIVELELDPVPQAAMTDPQAVAFARAHVEVWNSHDLDAILEHYSDDAVLSSPVARAVTGEPTIRGKPALRDYFTRGFERFPDLHFDLHHTFRGEHGLTLLFRGANGRLVAEVLRLDRDGRITRVDAHYACESSA
jgi:ketosteroid isomerase-like protein